MNTFDFDGQNLRAITIDEGPWFSATDVCRCIGLDVSSGTTMALKALASDEKRLIRSADVPKGFLGSKCHQTNFVSESGLYKLIMRANPSRPAVAAFQNWVTRDVLPAIRKTGGYLLNEEARETAFADTREAMPLPAEFAAAFAVRKNVCFSALN